MVPLSGTRFTSQRLRLGYFAQHQVEQLRADQSPLWHLARLEPQTREQELRDFLGGFDIRGDMATSPAGRFSGGEKARLTLAVIVRQRPNLLLLDEPTNHLDIEMREALTEALQDYEGALIVVAHDRHLLRATVDELWLVADGGVALFDGDLDDYRAWVLSRDRRAVSRDGAAREGDASDDRESKRAADRRLRRREEAEARQRVADERKPLIARQAAIEQDLERLTAEKAALDAWLATSEAYAEDSKERLVTAIARQGELTWTLARVESEWLELAQALDTVADRAGK
jgi:ATP-binding cassette subfamily F protein 3